MLANSRDPRMPSGVAARATDSKPKVAKKPGAVVESR